MRGAMRSMRLSDEELELVLVELSATSEFAQEAVELEHRPEKKAALARRAKLLESVIGKVKQEQARRAARKLEVETGERLSKWDRFSPDERKNYLVNTLLGRNIRRARGEE